MMKEPSLPEPIDSRFTRFDNVDTVSFSYLPMWFIVQTDIHKEQESKDLLMTLDGVRDVYLPLYRKAIKGSDGSVRYRFSPTVSGILFVNIDEEKIRTLITEWGYFKYKIDACVDGSRVPVKRTVYSTIRLLCFSPKETPVETIIRRARISNEDYERFRVYNDQLVNSIEDLKILDLSYQQLEADNDTVVITEGPYIGFEGIIRQVKTKGKKDRRLFFRIGNWCACISNVRTYRHIVVREAVRGMKAETVNAWRHIDHLTGRLQATFFPDDASAMLRKVLKGLRRNSSISQYLTTLKSSDNLHAFLSGIDNISEGCLISLSRYFQSGDKTLDSALQDMIPDTSLRPFLTPTPGMMPPSDNDYSVLCHNGFIEIIHKADLRRYFWTDKYEKEKYSPLTLEYKKIESGNRGTERVVTENIAIPDEDYLYYAHIGLFPESSNGIVAIVNWGGFCHQYTMLTADDRAKFHNDLKTKGYDRLHQLLEEAAQGTDLRFISFSPSVGGFAINIPDVTLADVTDPMDIKSVADAVHTLIERCSPTAVEMWQGTRLLSWRQLLQRYVLLHKIPVASRESVIPVNPELEQVFSADNIDSGCNKISQLLKPYIQEVERRLAIGNYRIASILFLQIMQTLTRHFIRDEHYNHIQDTYSPDSDCTHIYDLLLTNANKGNVDKTDIKYLIKGMKELRLTLSFISYGFPSCLAKSKQLEKSLNGIPSLMVTA
ncbi:MAG: hypothetical protein Q4D41_03135 [Prevotellaceae bacterium]|nr:hypothetical protein [Prevotellaceae bacterium]